MNKPIYSILAIFLAVILVIGFNPLASIEAQKSKSKILHENDFDKDTLETFQELFEDCPAGIVLYKLNDEMVVVCLLDSVNGKFIDRFGQVIKIDIDIDNINNNDNNNDNNANDNDNGNDNGNNNDNKPDRDCLFNPSLPKCASDNGDCPDGFFNNEDEQCVPSGGCPSGYHTVDDDETGKCISNSEGCPDGMVFREDGKTCGYQDDLCQDGNTNPNCLIVPQEQEQEPISNNNNSGNGNNSTTQSIEQEQKEELIPLVDITKDPINPTIPLEDLELTTDEADKATTQEEKEDPNSLSEESTESEDNNGEGGDGEGEGEEEEEEEESNN